MNLNSLLRLKGCLPICTTIFATLNSIIRQVEVLNSLFCTLEIFQTKGPSSKSPTKDNISIEKPKKKALDESVGYGKSRVSKADSSQRKLDAFTKSVNNSFTTKNGNAEQSLNKITPAKKDVVDLCSSPDKDDDKTPSGQLRGTPIKCRLVLTPVKSPIRAGVTNSPAHKKSGVSVDKTQKSAKPEDDTNDAIITVCKSPKTNSSKKVKCSPKAGKSKKVLGGTEELKKHAKDGNVSKKLDLSKSATDNSTMEKEPLTGAESKKETKQKAELVNVNSDSDMDFEPSPHKVNIEFFCNM